MQGTIDWEHEDEAGKSPLGVPALLGFKLDYYFTPGEAMVRYYSDGSGYPGSPAEVEFESRLVSIDGNAEVSCELKASIEKWFDDKFADSDRIFDAVNEYVAGINEDYDDQ